MSAPRSATTDCEVVTTRGGARAMRDITTGELMHPIVGPIIEAEQLYVKPSRLKDRLGAGGPPLVLLDVGLQLEFDEHALERPFAPDAIDKLAGALQPQP